MWLLVRLALRSPTVQLILLVLVVCVLLYLFGDYLCETRVGFIVCPLLRALRFILYLFIRLFSLMI